MDERKHLEASVAGDRALEYVAKGGKKPLKHEPSSPLGELHGGIFVVCKQSHLQDSSRKERRHVGLAMTRQTS